MTHPRLAVIALAGVLLGAGWLGYARVMSRLDAADGATAAALERLESRSARLSPVAVHTRTCPQPERSVREGADDGGETAAMPAEIPDAPDPEVVDELERDALDVIGDAVSAGVWTADDDMALVALTARLPRFANERIQGELSMAINAGELIPAE